MTRLLTALVAIPLLLALILRGPAWMFLVLVLAVAVQGYREMQVIAEKGGFALLLVGYLLTPLLAASFYSRHLAAPGFAEVAIASAVIVFGAAVLSRRPGRETLGAVAITLLGVFYVGGLLASVVGLRVVSPEIEGRYWIIFLLAVVMLGDAGAFYTGKALGRHPMAPELSPKKTMEGLAGGLVAAVAGALLFGSWLFTDLSWMAAAGLGIVLALLGVLGDLFASLLKRSAGVKDASHVVPGHGGVLDRIDSLLFAAPALFFYVSRTG